MYVYYCHTRLSGAILQKISPECSGNSRGGADLLGFGVTDVFQNRVDQQKVSVPYGTFFQSTKFCCFHAIERQSETQGELLEPSRSSEGLN